jgi:putative Mg2+ transporter-C (MgtC) family protein
MEIQTLDVVLRLLLATLIGAALGLTRDIAQKPMGMRTLGLVSLGAAAASLAVIQVPINGQPDALSRLIQGIVQGVMAGISFIGAGVIIRDQSSGRVDGLTTASTVWVTAAIGIGCALGAWVTVASSTLLAFVLLVAVPWVELRLDLKRKHHNNTEPVSGKARIKAPDRVSKGPDKLQEQPLHDTE